MNLEMFQSVIKKFHHFFSPKDNNYNLTIYD